MSQPSAPKSSISSFKPPPPPSNPKSGSPLTKIRPLTIEEQRRRNLCSFVEETHYDLVVRLAHFYDFFVQTFGSKGTVEDILRVLTFLGWHRLNRSSMEEFLISLDSNYICSDSNQLDRYCIRHIFREWLLRVSSTPELLHECFKYFDLDNNGYLSKEEIIKILYRTTEEERINLIQDVIEKLDSRIYFNEILGEQNRSDAKSSTTTTKSSTIGNKPDRKVLITKVMIDREKPPTIIIAKSESGIFKRSVQYFWDQVLTSMYRYMFFILSLYTFYIIYMLNELPSSKKVIVIHNRLDDITNEEEEEDF